MINASFIKATFVGVLVVTGWGATAAAGDWNNGAGGLKDFRGSAVPVPAPTPVPLYDPKWYFRADVGLSVWHDRPGWSESGMSFGRNPITGIPDTPSGSAFGIDATSLGFRDSFDVGGSFDLGFGYYWSKRWRSDLTLGVTSKAHIDAVGSYTYNEHANTLDGTGAVVVGPATGNRIDGNFHDRVSLQSGTLLFNTYVDLARFGRFTPYIGAGVGIAYHEVKRRNSLYETSCDCATTTVRVDQNTTGSAHDVTFAGAVHAGLVFNISDSTKLDLGYRFLYTAGTDVDMTINGVKSNIEIDDQMQHHFRAGLRWDIN